MVVVVRRSPPPVPACNANLCSRQQPGFERLFATNIMTLITIADNQKGRKSEHCARHLNKERESENGGGGS